MAAGIQSADELVLTEMIFNGVFSPLSPQQAVALLSCFLWHEKSDVGIKVTLRPLVCSVSCLRCHLRHRPLCAVACCPCIAVVDMLRPRFDLPLGQQLQQQACAVTST
jgi:DSHCT (NUC185) domain